MKLVLADFGKEIFVTGIFFVDTFIHAIFAVFRKSTL